LRRNRKISVFCRIGRKRRRDKVVWVGTKAKKAVLWRLTGGSQDGMRCLGSNHGWVPDPYRKPACRGQTPANQDSSGGRRWVKPRTRQFAYIFGHPRCIGAS
jgi:hypothetical protein